MKAKITGCLLACLVATGATAGESIDRRMDADADTLIKVSNVKGEIVIEGWDRDEVHLTGEIGEGSRDLEVSASDRQVRIEVSIPRNARAVEDTILYLSIPAGASVEAEGVSASIEIEGLDNRSISAQSVSGDISVEARTRALEVEAVSGDIEFEGRATAAELTTVSGDVDVEGIRGALSVNSVSGEILVRGGELRKGRFESVSGDLELFARLADDTDIVVESLSGDVDIELPASLSARLEAESYSGKIRSDRGEVRKARHGSQQSLDFTMGDGDGRIRIESFSGDVRIETR
ncbi:MAG: DUF4097 family beta strand repeat-containing protein [Pseudomonadota bacterium]